MGVVFDWDGFGWVAIDDWTNEVVSWPDSVQPESLLPPPYNPGDELVQIGSR